MENDALLAEGFGKASFALLLALLHSMLKRGDLTVEAYRDIIDLALLVLENQPPSEGDDVARSMLERCYDLQPPSPRAQPPNTQR